MRYLAIMDDLEKMKQHIADLEQRLNGQQNLRALANRKSKLASPPKFHGHKKELVKEFMFIMKNYLEACNEDKERWISSDEQVLHDAASVWFQHREAYRLEQGATDSWESFVSDMTKQFQPIDVSVVYRAKIATIKQSYR